MKSTYMIIFSVLVVTVLFSLIVPVNAMSELGQLEYYPMDMKAPKISIPEDIYVKSKQDIRVEFTVKAFDNVDGIIQVDCTKTSGSIFKVGKTKVHCSAMDYAGNISTANFVVTVGYNIVKIPAWIKHVTEFWVTEKIDDQTYMQTLGYLIEKEYLSVPISKSPNELTQWGFPIWIKNNGQLWSENKISDDEFSIGVQWLLNRGFIK